MDRTELITRFVNIIYIPGLAGWLQVDPPANYFDLLANLGVGGVLAGIMLWVLVNQTKAHNVREKELLLEVSDAKLVAAERVAKNEAETRAVIAGHFSRAVEVQDRTNEAAKAMALALTELTTAVKGIADAQALAGRIASLESKIDAVAKR